MTLESTVVRAHNVLVRVGPRGARLLTAGREPLEAVAVSLDAVGAFIWERLDGRHRIRQIAAELSDCFEVDPETAARDLIAFVDGLAREGCAREIDAGPAEARP